MRIPFKKSFLDNFYNYLFVSGHKCQNELECKEEFEDEYLRKPSTSFRAQQSNEISSFLSCTLFLMSDLEKYAIPNLPNLTTQYEFVKWRYEVLSNDFDGIGIDKGFKACSNQPLFPFEKLNSCINFDFTQLSIFGISANRKKDLVQFLTQDDIPHLKEFIRDGEIFAHISKGEDYGQFNSFLIKSKQEMDKIFDKYFNTINAGN